MIKFKIKKSNELQFENGGTSNTLVFCQEEEEEELEKSLCLPIRTSLIRCDSCVSPELYSPELLYSGKFSRPARLNVPDS